jgi:hypothetical protein
MTAMKLIETPKREDITGNWNLLAKFHHILEARKGALTHVTIPWRRHTLAASIGCDFEQCHLDFTLK